MASLHTVTARFKTAFKWGIILIIFALIYVPLYRLGVNIKEHYYPTPPEPPTVLFGKLEAIAFGQNVTDKKLTYTIDTVSGNLPDFPDKINVHTMQKLLPNFLNLERAEKKAVKLGFPKQGSLLSNTDYMWTETTKPNRQLFFDIISFNFSITSYFLSDPTLIQETTGKIDNASAQTSVTNLLTGIDLFPNDIDITKTKTTLLAIDNQKLISATSVSQASVVRIDFFQKDIDTLPIHYPNPPQSTMSFLLVGERFNETIIEGIFNHFSVDVQQSPSTYPIKTAQTAFKELQSGKAYIASYFGDTTTIRITNATLGYYMSNNPQEHLMPIIVFSGDNGFIAYVSAVMDEWIQTPPVQK